MSHSEPALDLKQAALLVIDVQCGAFDGRLCPPMPDGDALLSACRSALDWARQQRVPVFWIQHSEPGGPMDGAGFDIDPRLNPADEEPRFTKTVPNAFEETSLAQALQQAGRSQPILIGLQSDCCIEASARGALALGLKPWLVPDAHHTWPDRGLSAEALRDQVSQALAQAGVPLIPLSTLYTVTHPQSHSA
ncbi:cysteine hydrolase family protein [Kinneretia aquatilis]|uniref:cysteine hydrolase family protein n=1 Tax=Kinneretia aquatilis TaxID=2070761 RepID=UPI001495180E|nr:isochorismatase family protein [Paucibacter aquatile]WIV97947.1 isochorismatase family protein [Paucibacter aquatile]